MSSLYRIPGAVIYLLFCCLRSTAGEEFVKLQELEGNSVIIHTGLTAVQSDAHILWFYGPEKADINIVNSLVFRGETVIDYNTERFRDRLQLNRNNGSLTIRNISIEDFGLYKLQIIAGKTSDWSFRVNVYAAVSQPSIRNKKQTAKLSVSQRESCSPLCTVENGKGVNLSWFEEKEMISSISSTDSSDHLSLSLNLTIPNNSTYTCVAANPVSNKTTQLNITQICYINTDESAHEKHIIITPLVLTLLGVIVAGSLISLTWCWKKKRKQQKSEDYLNYAEVKTTAQNSNKALESKVTRGTEIQDQSDSVVYSDIMT
ncbi:natural killer cell receptor 2B4-like [Hoplias malabaricus]|uniref:natural killer cell receptor 2B4-like n=1 Tax=Hoplias malabaricus TaxID=27720 RepID=UPI00346188D2